MPNMVQGYRDPLRAQGFRTQAPERPEDLNQPLYDRVLYATAGTAGSLSFFSTALGGAATLNRGGTVAAVNKTFRDTNMGAAGVEPAKLHVFTGISVGFCPETIGHVNIPDDIEMIRENSYFEWKIVDKQILVLPLIMIPEVNPIRAASSTVNNDTVLAFVGGGGMPMYPLKPWVTLNPYENFTFTLKWDGTCATPSGNDVDIYVFLHGFMRRPT